MKKYEKPELSLVEINTDILTSSTCVATYEENECPVKSDCGTKTPSVCIGKALN